MTARTVPTIPSWSAGQEITSSLLNQVSSYLTWLQNPPMFRSIQGAAQSVSTGANTPITLDTPIYDSDSGLQAVSPYAYIVPFSGRWQLVGGVGWASNSTGARYAMIWQNGAAIPAASPTSLPISGAHMDITEATIQCAGGDVIALYGYQLSGGPLSTVGGGGQASFLEGRLVSFGSP